eukprot:6200462-Pleurochrysis_carterae.AAC.1
MLAEAVFTSCGEIITSSTCFCSSPTTTGGVVDDICMNGPRRAAEHGEEYGLVAVTDPGQMLAQRSAWACAIIAAAARHKPPPCILRTIAAPAALFASGCDASWKSKVLRSGDKNSNVFNFF